MFRQKFAELNPNPYSGKEGKEKAEWIPATEQAKPAPVQENKSDVWPGWVEVLKGKYPKGYNPAEFSICKLLQAGWTRIPASAERENLSSGRLGKGKEITGNSSIWTGSGSET
jgi:hypothetical protein